MPPERGWLRGPSLLRALVVRVTLVVLLALVGGYAVLYFEFRDGLWGLEGQSIAVQVQHLREAVVPGADGPRLELTPVLREFYAQPGTLNGFQVLAADGTVLEAGGYSAPFLPMPVAQGTGEVVMQMEMDASSRNSIMAAALEVPGEGGPYWVRVVRNLEDPESLVAYLMLGALDELYPPLLLLLVAVVAVVVLTVLSSLRPLRAVSQQASLLSLNRLDQRLPLGNLPRELVPLVHALNNALDRLEADYRVQREFTANAAHELRTPLATLRARLETRFSAEQLGDVALEIEQLARLIEQLLCLARLDSQEEFQVAAFDAHEVALEVARELAPLALQSDHHITALTPEASVPTHGNATLTRLVFRNLIENAIQYTPPGTTIALSGETHAVIIADDGPGIAAPVAAVLFERFRRAPDAPGFGAGLGLAIARCIMERQSGRLALEATGGRGAQFRMEFAAVSTTRASQTTS